MKKYRVLVADDQANACEGIKQSLDQKRFDIDTVTNLDDAIKMWNERQHDIVITDLCMPENTEGLDLLNHVKSRVPEVAVVIMTAYGGVDTAVQAMKLGASDYVSKPFTAEEIEIKIDKVVETIGLLAANRSLHQEVDDQHALIGTSLVMKELKHQIEIIAKSDTRVLITGEHGTGKELVAWAIQKASNRADGPFVRVNCAAIPETLIEAELFGSEKGAFSGATEKKQGRFQQADRGTLFLDEVGDMSPNAQAKVLRVLESGEILPVGGTRICNVDVRVIAATNKNIPDLMAQRQFREDLYYRLNTIVLTTPPLASRKEDIPALIGHFLHRMGRVSTVETVVTEEAREALLSWHWPGNVRELRNVIERALLFSPDGRIGIGQIKNCFTTTIKQCEQNNGSTKKTLKEARAEFERNFITKTLAETSSITEAAKQLDIQRQYLYEKMKELGMKG